MSQSTITQSSATPTVESLQQRLDDLESYMLDWLKKVSGMQAETFAIATNSNETVKRIFDRLKAETEDTTEKKSQVM